MGGYGTEEMGSDAMGGYSLDDYIYSLEARGGERAGQLHGQDTADIYGQLQQKERDLILAAELGKALLEKNEDLSKQNEKIAEDFSQKLEASIHTCLVAQETLIMFWIYCCFVVPEKML